MNIALKEMIQNELKEITVILRTEKVMKFGGEESSIQFINDWGDFSNETYAICHEFGVTAIVTACDESGAWEAWLDEQETVSDEDELREIEEYMNENGGELMECYEYQGNFTGSGIVSVGYYTTIHKIDPPRFINESETVYDELTDIIDYGSPTLDELAEKFIELARSIEEEDETDWDAINPDWIEAGYWFFTHNHEGQDSESYKAVCSLGNIFAPSILATDEKEILKEKYQEIAHLFGQSFYQKLKWLREEGADKTVECGEDVALAIISSDGTLEFGIEAIKLATGKTLLYTNTGDTCSEALCSLDEGETWFLSTWGDCVENAERDHYEETGEKRCFYCGTVAECRTVDLPSFHGSACETCIEEHKPEPETPDLGTVIHATLIPEDLHKAFLAEILELDPLRDVSDWKQWEDDEELLWIIEELMDALQEYAPSYCYFGAHEGNGSDFGFWPSIEGAEESCDFVSSKDQELPADDFEGEWLHVNDHGNATLYNRTQNEPRFQVVYHSEHVSTDGDTYSTEAEAVKAGETWKAEMVAIDEDPEEAEEDYSFEVIPSPVFEDLEIWAIV